MNQSTVAPLSGARAAALSPQVSAPAIPATVATTVRRKKLDALTSLRFFAAAFIVVGHAAYFFNIHYGLLDGITGGQGVTFFYVLSGFILTYSYPVLDWAGTRRFFVARIARIWPMHLGAIVLLMLLIVVGQNVVLDPGVIGLNAFLLQSWIPIPHYYGSFNPIAWSVSVEIFFYACFPLLVRNWRHTWAIKLGVTFLMLLGMITLFNYGLRFLPPGSDVSGVVYINPLARIFEFTIGVTTAQVWFALRDRIRLSRWIGTVLELAALGLLFFVSAQTARWATALQPLPAVRYGGLVWLVNGGIVVLPLAVLVFVLALDTGWLSRLLAFAPLVLLGEVSFSIYLTHITFLGYYLNHQELFRAIPDRLLWPTYWVVLIAACFVFWSLIEVPARHSIVGWYDRRFVRRTTDRPPARTPDAQTRPLILRLVTSHMAHVAAVVLLLVVSLAGIMRASETPSSIAGRTRTDTGMAWTLLVNGNDITKASPIAVSRMTEPSVAGWVVDRANSRLAAGVVLSIDGAVTVPLQYGQSNADIVKTYNDSRFWRGGFKGMIPSRQLTPGDHVVTLRVLNSDGHTYYESRKFGITVV